MNDLEARSADMTRSFLASHLEVIDEDSRLFQDLQHLAKEVLATLRSQDKESGIRPAGELRAYWPAMRPAA
jgi:hypothetical protein